MHCWAQGTRYADMPLEHIELVLKEAARFCSEADLDFGAFPMHEVAAHPDASRVLQMFGREFQPLTTTGVPLAEREDWEDVLAAARSLGTTTVWVAFHGVDAEHDRQVNRAGAFQETLTAVRRVHQVGMRVGCNVFLTKANLAGFDRLLDTLLEASLDQISFEPARYQPTTRSRRYATITPELGELEEVAERVLEHSVFHREKWSDLAALTEASYVELALRGMWPAGQRYETPSLQLVCRPNLDLHTGIAGVYGARHGNLQRDDPHAVFARALAHGPVAPRALYLPEVEAPAIDDLARRHGKPDGRQVHFEHQSMHYRWLDQMRLL